MSQSRDVRETETKSSSSCLWSQIWQIRKVRKFPAVVYNCMKSDRFCQPSSSRQIRGWICAASADYHTADSFPRARMTCTCWAGRCYSLEELQYGMLVSPFFWELTKSSKHGSFFATRIICWTIMRRLLNCPWAAWPILFLVSLTGSTFVAPRHSFPFNRFNPLYWYVLCWFFDNRRGSMGTDAWWRHIIFKREGFPFCKR